MTKLLLASSWPSTRGTRPGAMRSTACRYAISENTRSTGTCQSLATFSFGSACLTQ